MTSADYSQTFYLSPAYERIWGRPRSIVYENGSHGLSRSTRRTRSGCARVAW